MNRSSDEPRASAPRGGPRAGATVAALLALAIVAAVGVPACTGAVPPVPAGDPAPGATAAPAFSEGLEYAPPAAGSYDLPPIMAAADGRVLDSDNVARRLSEFMGDRLVLLSFIYTHCTDSEGCPLATGVLAMVREMLAGDPDLSRRVRLVSLSFDPARDTPAVMRNYALHGGLAGPGTDDGAPAGAAHRPWAFLTTASQADLQAILDGYGQSIVPEIDASGKPTGDFTHVLKVFLIDRRLRVRNIYSTSFLHPAIALNDLRTLWLEEEGGGPG